MLVRQYRETFPGTPDQVSRVRSRARLVLAGCPAADDVVLVLSEFAANAVLHSLSRYGGFTVTIEQHITHVYVEVEDDGGAEGCASGGLGSPGSAMAGPTGWTW
jgi:serine/threonine-protein kinase RsbW